MEVLVKQGRYRNAIKEAEELLRLNEKDNMGVHYDLMALYCLLEEEIAAYAGASYLYKPMIGFIKEVYNEVIS